MSNETMYTIPQAATILGLSVRTLRKWINDGRIKATKMPSTTGGPVWAIRESEVLRTAGKV